MRFNLTTLVKSGTESAPGVLLEPDCHENFDFKILWLWDTDEVIRAIKYAMRAIK